MAIILDTIFLSPLKFTFWVAQQLKDAAFEEMTDDSKIHEEMLHLQMELEMEEITEQEYEKREAVLFERLREIRKLKDEI